MRRKLRTNSAMKTITYGLFIYVSLTTIYGISAKSPSSSTHGSVITSSRTNSPSSNKLKCDLPSVIKNSNYVKECATVATNVTTLPDFRMGDSILYLCTGIFETAEKICQLNLTSINALSFDVEIGKSQSDLGKNFSKICQQMNDVISKPSYNLAFNSTVPPNIIKLNQNLILGCTTAFCWAELNGTSANPLCTVLLWENKILTEAKIPTKLVAISSQSQVKAPEHDTQIHTEPKVLDPNANVALSAKHETDATTANKNKKVKAEQSAPENKLQNAVVPNPSNNHEPKASLPESIDLPKHTKGEDKKIEKEEEKAVDRVEVDNPVLPQVPLGPQTDAESGADPPVREGAADLQGTNNAPDNGNPNLNSGAEAGIEEPIVEDAPGENEGNLDDGGEDIGAKVHNNIESPITEVKKGVSNQLNHTLPSFNHGKEDKPGGQDKAASVPESVVPQDRTLTHSGGPPDPPQHFFAYFMAVSFICLICYVGYHKKHKIMGIIFEGRKSRGGRGRRRPNTAGYRKLDCNLEEAVTSQCNSNVTHVIY